MSPAAEQLCTQWLAIPNKSAARPSAAAEPQHAPSRSPSAARAVLERSALWRRIRAFL